MKFTLLAALTSAVVAQTYTNVNFTYYDSKDCSGNPAHVETVQLNKCFQDRQVTCGPVATGVNVTDSFYQHRSQCNGAPDHQESFEAQVCAESQFHRGTSHIAVCY